MKLRTNLLIGCIAVLVLVGSLQAETITFKENFDNAYVTNYQGTDDALLADDWTGWGTWNTGAKNTTWIGTNTTSSAKRTIIRFSGLDVLQARLAGGDTVVSAKIRFYSGGASGSTGQDGVSVYSISADNADWVEGTGNFSTHDGVSWNHKSGDSTLGSAVPWVGGGGAVGSGDSNMEGSWGNPGVYAPRAGKFGGGFDLNLESSYADGNAFALVGWGSSFDIDLTTTTVTNWINNPAANGGVIIKQDMEVPGNAAGASAYNLKIEIYSSEADNFGPDGIYAPELIVELTPEPTTMALLGIGGLMALRRRRRK